MLELGCRQTMTGMETKRARGKCIANALVCQLCWTFLSSSDGLPRLCDESVIQASATDRRLSGIYGSSEHTVSCQSAQVGYCTSKYSNTPFIYIVSVSYNQSHQARRTCFYIGRFKILCRHLSNAAVFSVVRVFQLAISYRRRSCELRVRGSEPPQKVYCEGPQCIEP